MVSTKAFATTLLIFVSASCTFFIAESVDVEKDLTMSVKEKAALDKLQARVLNILPQDYMKKPIYLINWLRIADSNVNKAENMLRQNLEWREQNKMDQVIDEDFKFMEEEFPIDLTGVDKTGKPLLVVNIGDWDIRKSHLTGLHHENYRYSLRSLEIASKKVRDAQERGEAVTRFHVIFDLKGFNVITHSCLQCLGPYLTFVQAFQIYYPLMVDYVIFVNAPSSIYSILHMLRPIASPTLRNSMRIFGTNKAEWKKFLLSIIDPSQLDYSLGGTKNSI